jgi:hypothetical protein
VSEETDAAAERLMAPILDYLDAHPQAADGCVGIARWWLRPDADPEAVQRALDLLVARGALRCRQVPGGEPIYSAAGRAKEAEQD